MALSNELITQFVKATKDEPETTKETTVYGTVVTHNGVQYVKLDGSELLTPISTTANVLSGERVTVMIKNHTATVTGNISSPAARVGDVSDIKDAANKIVEFEIILSGKVDTETLNAEIARIDGLVSDNITVKETLSANEAIIKELQAHNVTVDGMLTANSADIDSLKANKLDVEVAEATYATIKNLDATNADIYNLTSTYGDFVDLTTDKFTAMTASIKSLEADKLDATAAEVTYANIDFSNIGKAAMEYFYANSGLIENVVVNNGTITGNLIGVTIKGNLIEAETLVADKLVILGTDGLYYKLNTNGVTTEAQQTDYNSLNGKIILAKSVTAEKISVDDLVAFGATIGGFNIANSSIYSGAKSSVSNTTRGIYLDNTGQVAFGDSSNYIKYYKDSDGAYKLAISADEVVLNIGSKNVADAIDEAQSTADTAKTNAATAQSTADTAKANAATAQSTADTAKANAATAQSTANTAKTNAATAQSAATAAQNTANTAKTNAATAQSTADTAKANAATAQSTADTAKTNAAAAQSTADTAKTNAATAQSTADTAKANAAAAQSAATAAQNTANAAKKQLYHAASGTTGVTGYIGICTFTITGAYANRPILFELVNRGKQSTNVSVCFGNENSKDPGLLHLQRDGEINTWIYKTGTSTWTLIAQKSEGYDTIYVKDFSNNNGGITVTWATTHYSTLPTSNITADTVLAGKLKKSVVDNAAKTATNYMGFSTSGLTVGDLTASTLKKNVLIGADRVDIRNGSTVLASYGDDEIVLGQNAEGSTISLCDGAGSITALVSESSDSSPKFDSIRLESQKLVLNGKRIYNNTAGSNSAHSNTADMEAISYVDTAGAVAALRAETTVTSSGDVTLAGVQSLTDASSTATRTRVYSEFVDKSAGTTTSNSIYVYPTVTELTKPLKIQGITFTGANKVLWSGASQMTASHTATLSEAVSKQPNGIILVFSEYANSAVSNTAFHHRFIPKHQVANHSGTGVCVQLSTSNLAYFGTKYLYISDTTVKGNDNNTLTGSSTCGITRTCNRFCLRYVIGV